jgi:phage-related protein
MAVVGEAHIIVKAITTGVGEEIQRALAGAQGGTTKEGEKLGDRLSNGMSRGFKKNKNPLGKLGEDAIKARNAFSNLQRTGFAMQTALGSLASSVGALIGGLGSLVSAAGAAAPALVAVAGAAVGMGLGMKLASLALGGVTGPLKAVGKSATGTKKTIKELREEMQQLRFDSEEAALSEKEAALNLEKARENLARVQDLPPNSMARREAELSYEQADLALRRAIDRNNDLQDEIKNGPKQDSGAGTDPYAGLTKSQKAFAKLLVALKPKFDALKEAVAKGFLPALGDGIATLMTKDFPVLERGFTRIGTALGNVSTKIFDMLDSAAQSGKLTSLFETSGVVIEKLGDALAKMFDAFLTILQAASPITIKFVGWIDKMATKFQTFINKAAGDGRLAKFFEDSAGFAADFGEVFGNIFGGLGAIIGDAFKPGSGASIMMDWLKKATAGFKDIGKGSKLHDFLAGAATNATKMFSVLGDVLGLFVKMGADKNVGKMWDTLGKGVPLLEKILQDGSDAGPSFAELVVQILRLISAFSDSETLTTFFDTLKDIAKTMADFFNQPKVKEFIDWLSKGHGWLLAIGLAAIVGKKLLMVMLGSVLKPLMAVTGGFKTFGGILGGFKTGGFKGGLKKIGEQFGKTGSDKDKFIDNLGKLDGKMTDTTKKTGGFKGMMSKLGDGFKKAGQAAKNLAVKIGTLAANIAKSTWAVMKNVGAWIAQKAALVAARVATIAKTIAEKAMKVATIIGTGVQAAFNAVMAMNPITLIIIAIVALVAALVWFFTQTEAGKAIFQGFMDFVKGVFDVLMGVFKAVGDFFVAVWNGIVEAVKFIFGLIVTIVTTYINIWIGIIKFAVGIIVAVFQGIGAFFKMVWDGIVIAFQFVWNLIVNAFKFYIGIIMAVFGAIGAFFKAVWDGIVNGLVAGWNFFAGIFQAVGAFINSIFQGVADFLIGIWNGFINGITNAINGIVGFFKGAWDGVTNFFKGFINGMIGMVEGFVNFFIDGINNIIGALSTLKIEIPDWVPLVGGQTWGINIPKIPRLKLPRLALGGVVSPSPGGSLVNIAEAGKPERVEPLDSNGMSKRDKAIMDMMASQNQGGGGGGISITVNPGPKMDEVELASMVSRRLAFELRKGATG